MNSKKNIWGTAIKSARMTAGLTQRDLAKELNCSQAYVNQMEKGHVGTNRFEEVINTLGFGFEIQLKRVEKVSV